VAQATNLPSTVARQVTQLVAETGSKAAAIHQDTTLSPEQRQAALQSLEQTVRPAMDALVPPTVQQQLPAAALSWLTQLSEGKYRLITPPLPGRNNVSSAVVSIASGAPPAALLVPLPRRPSEAR
jgi:hypothetical protein